MPSSDVCPIIANLSPRKINVHHINDQTVSWKSEISSSNRTPDSNDRMKGLASIAGVACYLLCSCFMLIVNKVMDTYDKHHS
jgi:hypothetical protein